mmetsp:Transcript_9565/g.16497  ORF Transcript_9565/g.16497 Transcript_9565/m.16497 type:complete len:306 (+) Transcript_9565:387-1304(+)
MKRSCDIFVHTSVVAAALEELALDEGLYSLLDDRRVGHEASRQDFGDLRHQVVVLHLLARLHHPHHRRLDLRFPVLVDLLPRLELLDVRLLLGGDGADPHPVQLAGESGVETEHVALRDLLTLGLLVQHPVLGARQRLQVPLQVRHGDLGRVLDVVVRQLVRVVEQQQHAHLVRGDAQLVPAVPEPRPQFSRAHVGLPREAAARVGLEVELVEGLAAAEDLLRELARLHRLRWPEAGRQDVHAQLHVAKRGLVAVVEEGLERLHAICGQAHVVEHALQLRRELVPALRLQLGDEASLRIVGHGAV